MTGQTKKIKLRHSYTYDVEIVSSKTYKKAVLLFFTPDAAVKRTGDVVSLTANKPLHRSFTVDFVNTTEMSTEGISISVIAAPSKGHPSQVLFGKSYSVTPAPGQVPAPSSSNSTSPNFGS